MEEEKRLDDLERRLAKLEADSFIKGNFIIRALLVWVYSIGTYLFILILIWLVITLGSVVIGMMAGS